MRRNTLKTRVLQVVVGGLLIGGLSSVSGASASASALDCPSRAGIAAHEEESFRVDSWTNYAYTLGWFARECHQRFLPVDPAWAEVEREWWVNLTWTDYAGCVVSAALNHHVRFVPA